MNKVTLQQLSQFQKDASAWFGQDPNNLSQFRNKSNVESPLGECILRVMEQVENHLKEWVDLGLKYNQEMSVMKARYADKVTIMENSSMQQNITSNYEYTGKQLEERNRVIQAMWDKLLADRKELEQKEVEIEPVYVKTVPPPQLLPYNLITSFRGIVIDPEYDHDKKVISIHK